MAKVNTAQMIAHNEVLFQEAKVRPEKEQSAKVTAQRLCRADNKAVFVSEEKRQAAKGNIVPWWFIAVTKEREAGVDSQFQLNIAQGDRWDHRSVHVPKGRGPFKNWFEAADDALELCAPYAAHWKDWSAGGAVTCWIRYNGLGYDMMGRPSPYAYAGTTEYVSGKYSSDGHYDPELVDKQLGCVTIIKEMMLIDPSIQLAPSGTAPRSSPPPKSVVDEKTKKTRAVRKAGVATSAASGTGEGSTQVSEKSTSTQTHTLLWAGIALGIVVVLAATAVVVYQKRKLIEEWF